MADGRYSGSPIVRLEPDGRTMTLEGEFIYTDPNGLDWSVPDGARIDGASIPRVLWPLIGSPLTGRYRDASIIHDWYCDVRTRPWRAVHRVFYDAMRTSGVGVVLAKTMYAGVYRYGPRWAATVAENVDLLRQLGRADEIKTDRPEAAPAVILRFAADGGLDALRGDIESAPDIELEAIDQRIDDLTATLTPEVILRGQ